MMKTRKVGKFFVRLIISLLWVLLIFFALYFPGWKILPSEERSINIFTWGDTLNPTVLKEFEQKTGIKVHLSYYSTNEELQVKMKATKGEGYDLILPSGYTVAMLVKENLLKPLNRNKLDFWSDLNPSLLNNEFDPDNTYSIPFAWEVYGLGVDSRYFADKPFTPSWKAIYDPNVINYKIAVSNDPIEAVGYGALYLYGKTDSLTEEEFQGVRRLLFMQRSWVEAYSDFRADYFIATGNCPIALATSTYIKRIRPLFPAIEFVVPEEGSFMTIENICIPKASSKEEYIYQLLNYLYSKSSMIDHYKNFYFFPATLSPLGELDLEDYEKELIDRIRQDRSKLHFFKNIMPRQQVIDLWVEVKSF